MLFLSLINYVFERVTGNTVAECNVSVAEPQDFETKDFTILGHNCDPPLYDVTPRQVHTA